MKSKNRIIRYKIPIIAVNAETGKLLEQIPENSVRVKSNFNRDTSGTAINLLSAINASIPIRFTFLKEQTGEAISLTTNNTAIWETSPKENIELVIYYEAS